MVNLLYKEKEIGLATNWKEVSLPQLTAIAGIDESAGIYERNLNIFKILIGDKMAEEDIDNMNLDAFNAIIEVLKFANEFNPTEERQIELGGKLYEIPSGFEKITVGQWSDGEYTITNFLQKSKDNMFKDIEKLMAIYLMEVKEGGKLSKYNSEKNSSMEQLIKDECDAQFVINFSTFFLQIVNGYLKHIVNSLKEKVVENKKVGGVVNSHTIVVG
jgi:hypothetical protein